MKQHLISFVIFLFISIVNSSKNHNVPVSYTDDEYELIITGVAAGRERGDGVSPTEGYVIENNNNNGRVLVNQTVHRLNKSQTIGVVISIMVGTAIFLYGLYRFEH